MDFDCKDCDEKFTCESHQKIHQNIAHYSFKFACGKCDKQFLSERSVNLHVKVTHSNHFGVKDSSKKNSKDLVKRIILVQSPNLDRLSLKKENYENRQRYKCKMCAKVLADNHNLKRHVSTIHQGHKVKCKVWTTIMEKQVGEWKGCTYGYVKGRQTGDLTGAMRAIISSARRCLFVTTPASSRLFRPV